MTSWKQAAKPSVLSTALCPAGTLWLHDLDHVRQGRPIDGPVIVVGFLAYVAVWVVVGLAYIGAPLQFAAALTVGIGTALGLVVVHGLPDWGGLSDGFPTAGVDAFSWFVLALAVVAAILLAIVGGKGRTA